MEGVSQFKKHTVSFINAIGDFFSADGISDHLRFLQNWINPPQDVFDDSPQKRPAQLLGFYEKLVPLFDYSDLIFNRIETDTAFVKAIELDECNLERESVVLDYCPKLLSKSEIKNPKFTFSDLFIFFEPDSYKIVYREWLMAGLEHKLDLDWDQYVAAFYENTMKMLEACWLIHERLITKNSFKSINRYCHMAMFESTSPLAFDQELFENPFKVIEFFFSLDNLAGHKTYLKNWYKAALSEEQRVSDVADYFFLYNQFTKLLNAGYLIAEKQLKYQHTLPEDLVSDPFVEDIEPPHALHEVNTLPAEHVANPYRFAEHFFVPEKIKQLRLGLLEWLYAAFSNKSSIKLMDKEFLFEQYEALMMMMEAFFVMINNPSINDDEMERSYYAE